MDSIVPMPHRLALRSHFAGHSAKTICSDAAIPLHKSREEAYRSIVSAPSPSLRVLAQSLLEEPKHAQLG